MRLSTLFIAATISITSLSVSAYELCGNSNDGFELKCNDGTVFMSSMPPNHNTATARCEGHGGVAAGYPRKVLSAAKTDACVSSAPGGANHNTVRSNRRLSANGSGLATGKRALDKSSPMLARDGHGGRLTGVRQHGKLASPQKPVRVAKEIDKATPALMNNAADATDYNSSRSNKSY